MEDINLLEKFIFSDNKQKILEELRPFKEKYFIFSTFLKIQQNSQSPQDIEELEKLLNSEQGGAFIKLKLLFKKLDTGTTEQRKEVIQQLNRQFFFESFNEVQGQQFQEEAFSGRQENKLPSELSQQQYDSVSIKVLLQKFYNQPNLQDLERFTLSMFLKLDFNQIPVTDQSLVNRICERLRGEVNVKNASILTFLGKINQSKNVHIQINIICQILSRFPYEDHHNFLKKFNLLGDQEAFSKLFSRAFDNIDYQDLNLSVEQLKEMTRERIKFLDGSPGLFKNNIQVLRRNLLSCLYKRDQVDEDLLIKYLESPLQNEIQHQLSKTNPSVMKDHVFLQQVYTDIKLHDILKLHLTKQEKTSGKPFEKLFDQRELEKLVAIIQFFKGEEVNLLLHFSEPEIKEMNDRKILKVKGKQTFVDDEEVELTLEMKNIKKLNIKVFEVNTENYINSKNTDDYSKIVVDFLIPSEEYSYSFEKASSLVHLQTLKFERIQSQKLGVFIVNIIGDEMFAKAIIKKGSIALVYDEICGRNSVVVDENQNILKGENTGIYVQNKLIKCNPETGIIHVPESIAALSRQVTVVHNGFAVYQMLQTMDYQYELKLLPLFNQEEMIAGRQARFIFPVKLYLNNEAISLKSLKNSSIEIVFKKSGGVTQKKQFQDLQLSDSEDLVIETIIPSKLESFTINMKAEIQRKETIQLKDSFSKTFSRPNLLNGKYTTLCQNEKQEYYLKIMGSNGESLSNNKVQLHLRFDSHQNNDKIHLCSNQDGVIHLGLLTDCLSVQVSGENINEMFELNQGSNQADLPAQIMILANEKAVINNPQNLQVQNFFVDRAFTKNLFDFVQSENRQLIISGLEEGNYTITFENQRKLLVKVMKGKYIELNGQKIHFKNLLLNLPLKQNALGVEIKDEGEEYKLSVNGWLPDTRLHVMLSNFPIDLPKVVDFEHLNIDKNRKEMLFRFSNKDTQYFSDGRLNDELVYVMKRKTQKNFMGNTLDKPGTILKRQKVKDTQQDNEKINPGCDAQACSEARNQSDCIQKGGMARRCSEAQNALLDFLQNDPNQPNQVIPNFALTEGNCIIQKNSLGNYHYIYFYVSNQNGKLVKRLVNHAGEKSKTDLRLKEQRQKGSIFRYSREIDYFGDKSKFTIPHVQKQEFCFLETLEELFEMYKLVYELDSLDEWKFLATWAKQSNQEKLQKYDKMCSHEFNLFIYFKDRSFFEGVVLPFIKNKKEKSLIDYFFIGDQNQLKKKMVISELQNLNVIERSLLYIASLEISPEFAQIILEDSQMLAKLNKITDQEYKLRFDSILQSSQKKEAQDEVALNCPSHLLQNFSNKIAQPIAPPPPTMGLRNLNSMASGQMRMMTKSIQPQKKCLKMKEKQVNMKELYNDYRVQDEQIQVFQPTQATVEYEERQYYSKEPTKEVIQVYIDFMQHWKKEGSQSQFFSVNFFHSHSSLSQVLFLLSILDLPFAKEEYKSELTNGDLQIDIQTRLVCLTKEVIEEQGKMGESKVMLQQKFFDIEDKYVYSEETPGLQHERPAKEFAIGRVYESALVITNPSSIPQKISVIHEIPQGSIPIRSLDQMKIEYATVNSLQSMTYSINFYFPEEGEYGCYPATAVAGENILGMAVINEKLTVRKERVLEEVRTLSDALRSGSIEKVEEFLKERNIRDPNVLKIEQLLGLLRNKEFFTRIVKALRNKGYFDKRVWKYSIYHNEENEFREYLQDSSVQKKLKDNIRFLRSDWLEIDQFKLLEYHPLVNARAFSLREEKTEILNKAFRETYSKFLVYLIEKGKPDQRDWVVLGNYLIAQDRIEEALDIQTRIKEEELGEDCRIQWDYQQAYLDFTTGFPDFKKAKEISDKYLTYPVLSWRNLFVEVLNQITEFEEGDQDKEQVDQKNKKQEQSSFSASVENDVISISHKGMQSMIVKLYKVDLETFYSLRPFGKEDFGEAAFVTPFKEERVTLNSNGLTNFPLPQELKGENMFIEVKPESGEKSEVLSYSPFAFKHTVSEEFGTVKIIEPESGKPVPRIYMKCFVKYKNGSNLFYKDGFTDIRGSFDFVSLNKDSLDEVEKFRIMICAGQKGFKVIESNPPKKIGKVEGQAKKLISKQWQSAQMQPRYQNSYQNVCF